MISEFLIDLQLNYNLVLVVNYFNYVAFVFQYIL